MTEKHIRELNPEQQAVLLAELKRGPPPVPVTTTKTALEMTELERREYLAEHRKRFGV